MTTKLSLKEKQGRRRIIMEKKNHGCKNTGAVNVRTKAAKRRFEQIQIDVDDSIHKSKQKKRLPSSAYNTRSSLRSAVEKEDIQFIQYLLSQGTSVNVEDELQRRALHVAASKGNAAIVKLLLDYKAEVTVYDFKGNSPLHFAAESGNLEIIEYLLKAPPVDGRSVGINEKNQYQETPLHIIALKGHTQLVKHMIRLGADVNARNYKGSTPLRYAAAAGNAKIVKMLLLYGVDLQTEEFFNPWSSVILADAEYTFGKSKYKLTRKLSQSRILKQIEVIDALMKGGANFNDYKIVSPLIFAVSRGHEDIVKKLLDYGAEANAVSQSGGYTALHEAARRHKSPNICKMLIDAGADVNQKDKLGYIPLHYAVLNRHKQIVSALLAAGSDINSVANHGEGLLMLGTAPGYRQDWELLNILFESGLDFNKIVRVYVANAFHCLEWTQYKDLLAILIDCNPDLNALSGMGETPLKYWVDRGDTDEFEEEIEFMIKTMVKMEFSCEFRMNDINMKIIEDAYFDFYVECKKEVKDMMSKKVCDDISFFDLLNKPMLKLVHYCENQELVNYLDSSVYKQFKNYSCIIELRMRAAMKKNLLLKKCVKVLNELVKPIQLPQLVSLRILGNFISYDLESLSCSK